MITTAHLTLVTTELNALARKIFTMDGFHESMVFFMTDEGKLVKPLSWSTFEVPGADPQASILAMAKGNGFFAMITIAEAWMYKGSPNDHTARQLMDGEMRVSDLNDSDKDEALVVTMAARDGRKIMIMNAVERNAGPDGAPTLQDPDVQFVDAENTDDLNGKLMPNRW